MSDNWNSYFMTRLHKSYQYNGPKARRMYQKTQNEVPGQLIVVSQSIPAQHSKKFNHRATISRSALSSISFMQVTVVNI